MPTTRRRDVLQAGILSQILGNVALVARARAGVGDPAVPAGIPQDLARHRVTQIAGVRYDLALDVTAGDQAAGNVAIGFQRPADTGDLLLDFRGPNLRELVVNGRPLDPPDRPTGHLLLPAGALRVGENAVTARFDTPIAAAGAAIIRFHDESDDATYLYTLLVPSDANLLFPCFDQPDLKARFRWSIVAPKGWRVLTNGAPQDSEPLGAATRWRFAETQPISTYLAAFAAGPWTTWASAPPGERPITLYARASRRPEVEADAIIGADRAALRWLADWFGVPFPFAKLDLLLAPAFPFGGMEHVGAVFYKEDSFVFREPPTLVQRLLRDQTIYHEISHQWFGDDVTMRWFDDLWLKEGFATYMAARVQADLQPDSQAWTTFLLRIKTAAYRADSTRGTTPLWQSLDNLDAAKSAYGPVVYNKAPAVIKQLAFLTGEAAFRRGLHLFLTRHAYGNATWRDLLGAVGEAAGADLDAFGRQYVLRPGLPRIETRLVNAGERIGSLTLVQKPARTLPGDTGEPWPMRLRVRLGYRGRPDAVLDVRFEDATVVVPDAVGLPVPDYVWPNDGDEGYGLFLPDARTVAWTASNVGATGDTLLRAMLWGGLWDTVRDARFAPDRYVEVVLAQIVGERDEQVSHTVLSRAATAMVALMPAARSAAMQPRWEAALIARIDDPTLSYGLRKDALDRLIETARTPLALDRLRRMLGGATKIAGKRIGQPTRWAAIRRLTAIGTPDAAALFATEQRSDTSTEAIKDAFVARAATPAAAVKRDYFKRYFDDVALNEEWASESLGAFNTVEQAALTMPFLRPALDRLEWIRANRRIFFMAAWIDAFIGGQIDLRALAIVDAFLADHPTLAPDIRRKIMVARDELAVVVEVRETAGA